MNLANDRVLEVLANQRTEGKHYTGVDQEAWRRAFMAAYREGWQQTRKTDAKVLSEAVPSR